MSVIRCPACGAVDVQAFHRLEDLPAHSCLLHFSRQEAVEYPRGQLMLGFCHRCGFISNVSFDPALNAYSRDYEETQGFSPRFRRFMDELAEQWIERYDLHGKQIVEIGCGKGEFLVRLCELGNNYGVGIDPSYVPERINSPAAGRIRFLPELYSDEHGSLAADAIVCRHTLEHIQPVGEFMRRVRRSIGDRSDVAVLFELPDVRRVLEEGAFWDVYYEHCSYFSLGSLARLFASTGFSIRDLRPAYDDQYLLIEAVPAPLDGPAPMPAIADDLAEMTRAMVRYQGEFEQRLHDFEALLSQSTGRIAIWGSGSKGVAFLNALANKDRIAYVVDINPFKQGKFMAGSGHPIVSPEHLKHEPPELVIAMNPVYLQEIRRQMDELFVAAKLLAA